jgi:hypothetical protein
MLRPRRQRLHVARDPGLLAFVGAALLICAPALPGLSRIVVLPALLLAPGYALLRLLGQAARPRSIPVAVPVSLVLAICASLILYIAGIRLSPLPLGLFLGAITALLLAGSYGRLLASGRRRHRDRTRQGDQARRPHRRPSGYLLNHRSGPEFHGGRDASASERR